MKLENLRNIFISSEHSQFQKGLSWYKIANREAKRMSKTYDVPLHVACGIISALSPSVAWDTNLKQAELFIQDQNTAVSTYGANKAKAMRLLYESPDVDGIKSILLGNFGNGLKTMNFFMNIYQPSNPDFVTIDRWIYRAIEIDPNKVNTKKVYPDVKEYIRKQAELFGCTPSQFQAVVWEQIRG